MIRTMVDTTFLPPADIDEENASSTEFAIWKADIKLCMEKREWYVENKCTLYSVIWSQCPEAMQAKIKAVTGYQTMNEDANSLSCFKDSLAVIEHYGGNIGDDDALVKEELKNMTAVLPKAPTADQLATCTARAKNKSNAIFFPCCADPGPYALLTTDLENQFTRGNDQYPDTITDAYNLLVRYKKPATGNTKNRETNSTTSSGVTPELTTDAVPQTELAFVQTTPSPPIEEVKCYNCNTMGHYASSFNAPSRKTTTGVQFLQNTEEELDGDDPTLWERAGIANL
jgi:Zinc knuckle